MTVQVLEVMSLGSNQEKVMVIRGQRVMLDRDVADCLGVGTKQLNENAKQSPKWRRLRDLDIESEYRFQITEAEMDQDLRSKSSTIHDFKYLPWVYTEIGVAHFGTSLNSDEACRLAIQLSRTFAKVQELKRIGATTRENPKSDYQSATAVVASMLQIGRLLGAPASLAKVHAVSEASRHFPDVNLRFLLGHNPDEVQELDLTPTELARELGLKGPREVNKLLAEHGFQVKTDSGWEPTEAGRAHGILHRTGKSHSNGTAIHQLKWKKGVVKVLRVGGLM